jgi:hypothetical protein
MVVGEARPRVELGFTDLQSGKRSMHHLETSVNTAFLICKGRIIRLFCIGSGNFSPN